MTNDKIRILAGRAGLAVALALLVFAMTARGAAAAPTAPGEPVFPAGSRVGLVPPPGMTPSKQFSGFADSDKNAGIVINTLPPGSYADMQKTLTDDALKKQGMSLEKRDTLQLAIGKGDLVVATQVGPDKITYRKWLLLVQTPTLTAAVSVQVPADDKTYSDAAVRATFATLALRSTVPEAEFLSLLPFTIGDFAGFRIGNVIPGRALLLIDAPQYPHLIVTQGLPEYEFNGRFIVTAAPGSPSDPDQRANLARATFNSIEGIKDIHITMAEPVRIDSQQGFETVASAKDAGTGADLMVIQWLRFGGGAFLQMIGISRADIWDSELSRLRTIRDSIAFR